MNAAMQSRLLTAMCGAVLAVVLCLGLWPFHVPPNDVTRLKDRNGLHFGKYSTVFSSSEFRIQDARSPASGSLEIWLQPGRIWDFSTFLAFYNPENPLRFTLRQSQKSLLLRAAVPDDRHPAERVKELYVDSAFRENGPTFVTVTSGAKGMAVYIDGIVARRRPDIQISSHAFEGRLVLGDSPMQADSWTGRLLGLSIYGRELTAAEVRGHYDDWMQKGRPHTSADQENTALYLFEERTGKIIHNDAGPGPNLYIPEQYAVLGQIFLETPWGEFRRSQDFWGAILKNIVGFIPFGACFYAYFSLARQAKQAARVTVLLGFAASLTIEVLQVFLPMRASGMMDLVTNTLGTYIGVLAFRAARPIVAALWPVA